MQELRHGLWHWTAIHPQWTAEDDLAGHRWGPEVSSYAFSLDDGVMLIDPVIPQGGLDDLLAGRQAVTVLTCPSHARDALKLRVPLFAPPPDPGDAQPLPAENFTAGDTLAFGITAFPGLEPTDLVLWVERYKALVFGDTLVDHGSGLGLPYDWGPQDVPHPDVLRSLRSLLELPIEHVLPTHGPPTDRAAFECALG